MQEVPRFGGRAQVDTGFWLVVLAGGIAFGNGMLMLLGPGQFASPAYALVYPFVTAYGGLLTVSGFTSLLFAATGRRIGPVFSFVAPLALLPLWASFARAGLVTGVVTLGVQIAAAALAGGGLLPRLKIMRPTITLIAVIQVLQSVAMIAVPQQFSAPALYGSFSTFLWIFAPSFAVAGIGLFVSRQRRLVVMFGTLAAANFAALAITFIGTRIWTGVINYGAMVFLVLLALSQAPTRTQALRLLFGATGLVALADLARWVSLAYSLPLAVPDGAVIRPVTAAGLAFIGGIGLWSVTARSNARTRVVTGVAALAVVLLAASELRNAIPDARVMIDLQSNGIDPRTSRTSLVLLSLTAVAVGAPLVWSRPQAKVVAIVAAIIVCAVSGANLFAYLIDQPALFSAFGIVTLRLHTALVLVAASSAVLLQLSPPVSRASLAGRLSLAFGAILALVALEALISISSTSGLIAQFLLDPARAEREAQATAAALVGLLIVIGVAMLVIAYGVTRSIALPFRQLSDAMRRFADGDRSARVLIPGRDEIARAGAAFNAMARELQGAHEDLEDRALHDPLTGLPNRRLLGDRLDQALRQAARDATGVAVLGLDLNGFKRVNDTLGHAAGDEVLVAVAARLLTAVRPGDTIGRFGGDEFTIVLPGGDRAAASMVADRIHGLLRQSVFAGGEAVTVGTSVGIATCPADGSTADALLAAADRAMYAMKPVRA